MERFYQLVVFSFFVMYLEVRELDGLSWFVRWSDSCLAPSCFLMYKIAVCVIKDCFGISDISTTRPAYFVFTSLNPK